MNEVVKETIKILQNNSLVKSGSYEFIGDSDIIYAEIYILLKFIEDLQQENKQLKEKLDCDLQWAFKYEKQVDNWNKLKEWLKEYEEGTYGLGSYETGLSDGLGDVIKKMQELEGSDNK
jgi:hypothetical protein